MSKTFISTITLIGIAVAAIWTVRSRQDQIRVYTIPKENLAAPGMSDASQVHGSGAPLLHYTLPDNWSEQAGSHSGERSFKVTLADDRSVDASLIPFPTMFGPEALLVNIARGQLGLNPVSPTQLSADGISLEVGDVPGVLYDLKGPDADPNSVPFRMMVVIAHQGSTSWFFKLAGENEQVEHAKPSFLQFLESMSFPQTTDSTAQVASAAMDTVPAASAGERSLPPGDIPPDWTSTAPGPMIAAAFTGPNNTKITLTSLAGTAGGLLANVNRWRRQINLAPVDQAQLEDVVQRLTWGKQSGWLVDMVQATGQTRKRIVAIVVTQADKTWFYKLTGTDSAVDPVKDELITFVGSIYTHDV